MKKNLLTILALLSFAVCSAQFKIQSNYDVDGDGKVSIADVTSTVNKVLDNSQDERVVVDGVSLNAALQDVLSQLNSLDERIAVLKNMKCSCSCDPGDPYNGHEYVDLGLPSGLKWATMNIGASSPEGHGDYFAWGETKPYYTEGHSQDYPCNSWITGKTGYNWASYKLSSNGDWTGMKRYTAADGKTDGFWYNNGSFVGDNKSTLELGDDAAHANWGGGWRMPTKAELDELRENCTWTWDSQNGVDGYRVSSKTNSSSIFLPASGWRDKSYIYDVGEVGRYWTSSLNVNNSRWAQFLNFGSSSINWNSVADRFQGHSVRAVCR